MELMDTTCGCKHRPDALCEYIAAHAVRFFPDLRNRVRVQVDRAFRKDALHYRFVLQSGEERRFVWAKVGRADLGLGHESESYGVDTLTEYRHLKAMERCECSHFGSPRPLAYLDEHQVLLTEEAPGVSFLKVVLEGCRSWRHGSGKDLAVSFNRCAKWLRTFHNSCDASAIPNTPDYQRVIQLELIAIDEATHEITSQHSYLLGESLTNQIMALAPVLKEAMRTMSRGRTAVHADFGLGNMIIDQGKLVIFDMNSNRLGYPESDVATLLCQIEMIPYHNMVNPIRLKALRAVFLNAYYDQKPLDGETRYLLQIFRLTNLLRHVDRHTRVASRLRRPVRDLVLLTMQRVYRREITRVLADLDRQRS